jgi:hypothetical protein
MGIKNGAPIAPLHKGRNKSEEREEKNERQRGHDDVDCPLGGSADRIWLCTHRSFDHMLHVVASGSDIIATRTPMHEHGGIPHSGHSR